MCGGLIGITVRIICNHPVFFSRTFSNFFYIDYLPSWLGVIRRQGCDSQDMQKVELVDDPLINFNK